MKLGKCRMHAYISKHVLNGDMAKPCIYSHSMRLQQSATAAAAAAAKNKTNKARCGGYLHDCWKVTVSHTPPFSLGAPIYWPVAYTTNMCWKVASAKQNKKMMTTNME